MENPPAEDNQHGDWRSFSGRPTRGRGDTAQRLPFNDDALTRRQRENPVAARLEPRILRELLAAIDAGPLVVVEHDQPARQHAIEERLERGNLARGLVEVDVQIGDALRRALREYVRNAAAADLDGWIARE